MVSAPTKLPTQPGFITLSPEEREAGEWSRANLQRGMELLHRDGLLAMSGIVDKEHLVALRDSMLKTAKEIRADKTKLTDFNHGVATNHLQSPPLSDPSLLFPDVFSNEFVHQIVRSYLGPDIQMAFITANTALPNTKERQPVHKDAPWAHPLAPYMLNTNFPLSDFTPENGSTEFWLGSHLNTTNEEQLWRSSTSPTPTCDVTPACIAERLKTRPGEQIRVPFGTVMLRDMRTWHAGMPNSTDAERIMIAVGYSASWYPSSPQKFKAPLTAKDLLTKRTPAEFEWLVDADWERISQRWGLDEDSENAIFLPASPGMAPGSGTGKGWDGTGAEPWDCLNVTAEQDKVVNPNFNTAAIGA